MNTRTSLALAFVVAALAGACSQKKDTNNPDDKAVACTEEAKVCPDGSSVGREGPNCEFAACPGEGEAVPEGDEPAGEEPADAEAPTDEAAEG